MPAMDSGDVGHIPSLSLTPFRFLWARGATEVDPSRLLRSKSPERWSRGIFAKCAK
jgi:hypothetical protein